MGIGRLEPLQTIVETGDQAQAGHVCSSDNDTREWCVGINARGDAVQLLVTSGGSGYSARWMLHTNCFTNAGSC